MTDERTFARWTRRWVAWGLSAEEAASWDQQSDGEIIARLTGETDTARSPEADTPEPDTPDPDTTPRPQGLRPVSTEWVSERSRRRSHLRSFMELHWINWFGVAGSLVKPDAWMGFHLDTLHRHALDPYGSLLGGVCRDPAFMRFLNADLNRARLPNQNLARELLELYTVGVGAFDERDVEAASAALSGWVIDEAGDPPIGRHDPARHDARRRTLMGVNGVNSLDTVIGAALGHGETAERVGAGLAQTLVGAPDLSAVPGDAWLRFVTDYEPVPLVAALLERAAETLPRPRLLAAIPWVIQAMRVTDAEPDPDMLWTFLVGTGSVPADPVPLEGLSSGDEIIEPVPLIARAAMAAHLASRAHGAIAESDDRDLAAALGIGAFGATSRAELAGLDGPDRIAAALLSTEFCVV